MTRTIVIGDIQGCFDELQQLLGELDYNSNTDLLCFTGDLVNRGPHSLEVLRFVKNLKNRAITVLGNHDLHLLAVAAQAQTLKGKDTLDEILSAPDRDELLDWLRMQPLLLRHREFVLTHAGIYPDWDLPDAERFAHEAETVLRSDQHVTFFRHMYGNHPVHWNEQLTGWDRMRFIVNSFTRMRYVDHDAGLELKHKGPPGSQPSEFAPWFTWPLRKNIGLPVVFGHWSALGLLSHHGVCAIDTGCLWGGSLSALIFENGIRHHSLKCKQMQSF